MRDLTQQGANLPFKSASQVLRKRAPPCPLCFRRSLGPGRTWNAMF